MAREAHAPRARMMK